MKVRESTSVEISAGHWSLAGSRVKEVTADVGTSGTSRTVTVWELRAKGRGNIFRSVWDN